MGREIWNRVGDTSWVSRKRGLTTVWKWDKESVTGTVVGRFLRRRINLPSRRGSVVIVDVSVGGGVAGVCPLGGATGKLRSASMLGLFGGGMGR